MPPRKPKTKSLTNAQIILGTIHRHLRTPHYRTPVSKDLKHLRDMIKFTKIFPRDLRKSNNLDRYQIQPAQQNFAWFSVIRWLHEHGTCGKFARGSYGWIFILFKLYCQAYGHNAEKYWLEQKEMNPALDDFEKAELHDGDHYHDDFLNWLAGVVKECDRDVQIEIRQKLWPGWEVDDLPASEPVLEIDSVRGIEDLIAAFKRVDLDSADTEEADAEVADASDVEMKD